MSLNLRALIYMSKHRPTYVCTYVCTYLCLSPLFVWSPRAHNAQSINMQALTLRASRVALRLGAVTFCHYAHNCVECKVFVVLNAHALCAVRCVLLTMLYALSVRKGQHVPVSCIHGRLCLCRCVVCLSLFHGAILRRIFVTAKTFCIKLFYDQHKFSLYLSICKGYSAKKKFSKGVKFFSNGVKLGVTNPRKGTYCTLYYNSFFGSKTATYCTLYYN